MLTFNLKTTFFTVKTSNEVYCCRIYFVIQNIHSKRPYNKQNITRFARRYGFYVLVARTISHSFAALTREILFLPLEHKIHIFSQPCNILYISREIDRLSRDKLSMPPGMKGILCIKFDLFKIKNTDFWAAYGHRPNKGQSQTLFTNWLAIKFQNEPRNKLANFAVKFADC